MDNFASKKVPKSDAITIAQDGHQSPKGWGFPWGRRQKSLPPKRLPMAPCCLQDIVVTIFMLLFLKVLGSMGLGCLFLSLAVVLTPIACYIGFFCFSFHWLSSKVFKNYK